MKRYNNLYEKIYDFENLYEAYKEARRCKRYREEVLKFSSNLEENLIQIQNELIWKMYKVGRYREFYVYEPKKRLIMALPFKDRVVQWAIYRVLNPIYNKTFIEHSYACRIGKGTHKAAQKLQYWLRKVSRKPGKWYYLKLDISKYFYRIDHEVLTKILRRKIKDKNLIWLLELIIKSEDTKFGLPLNGEPGESERIGGKGIPIGNLTSQLFANIYLNELDQFVKHVLKVKYYMRYMDDVIVLSNNKKHLHYLKAEIENYLNNELKLHLNNKTAIRPITLGIEFVGYKLWPTHVKLKKKTSLKIKRRLKYLKKAFKRKGISFSIINSTVQSYMGLLKHCNSYGLRKKIFDDFVL
ncbi:reverse transcriptase/maturase family protein [Caloramator australicus]|uniref:Retron-type reverse transcriptase n=1 Tax=Caloramator australicus RC3 TaxID=857293 RepID=I7J4R1_9CLOT|nr:reverse transcriptase/maturase family protein [Caloramator australicus]CCJ32906.1 Retron-type reverse transcriptase [Caloramator australicus RC3]